jgi:hypothetical protein
MKFFTKLFKPNMVSKAEKTKKGHITDAGLSDMATHALSVEDRKRKQGKKETRSKPLHQTTVATLVAADHQTRNEKIGAAYCEMINRHTSEDEIVSFYASPKSPVKMDDMPCVTSAMLADVLISIYKSFPDFHLNVDTIKEVSPGKVRIEIHSMSGTHTGAPYSVGNFPPVETSNKYCVNDPEMIWFTINEAGKITLAELISLGGLTGAVGLYLQGGGTLDMPNNEAPSVEDT